MADTIFDDILGWINSAVSSITSAVTDYIANVWSDITNAINTGVTTVINSLTSWLTSISDWVQQIWYSVGQLVIQLGGLVSGLWSTVSGAVTSSLGLVQGWLQSGWDWLAGIISSGSADLQAWISTAISNLWSSLSTWLSSLAGNIESGLSTLSSSVLGALGSALATVTALPGHIADQLTAGWTWLTSWISNNVVKPLAAWWDQFLAHVFDFASWIGKLFDALSAWFTVDIPGHSPRWHAILDAIVNFLVEDLSIGFVDSSGHLGPMGKWFKTWFFDFPKYFFGDLPQNTAYGLQKSWEWVSTGLTATVQSFVDAIAGFAEANRNVSQTYSPVGPLGLLTTGLTAVAGLGAMTIAGELLHPLKNLGLGNLAAIMFDLTDYKALTGAFVGALAKAAIATPMEYYYNDLYRPTLPNYREAQSIYGSDGITREEFSLLLAYEGFPDKYHELLAFESYRPMSPFYLKDIAAAGAFDETTLSTELRRAAYSPGMRVLLLDFLRKSAATSVKAVGLTVAVSRYKQGMTDQSGLEAELRLLNLGDSLIPSYVNEAKLEYVTELTTDAITAYTDGVRAGNLSLEDYRQALLGLGLQPDRVEAKVLIEQLRVKPKATKTVATPAAAYYTTPAGTIEVDTIRRLRRAPKSAMTHDQEAVALQQLGMPTDYAEAIANNDDIRVKAPGG